MKLQHALLVVLLITILTLTYAAVQYKTAANNLAAVRTQAQQTISQSAEIESLRSKSATAASAQPPQQDLFARATQHLAAVGLPSNALERASIGPSHDSDSPRYREITADLNFRRLAATDLMRLLDHWRSHESVWAITTVDLIAAPDREQRSPNYTASLGLQATYLDEEPQQ